MYDRLLRVWKREIGLMDLDSASALQSNHAPEPGKLDSFRHAIWLLATIRKWDRLAVEDIRNGRLQAAWSARKQSRYWSKAYRFHCEVNLS